MLYFFIIIIVGFLVAVFVGGLSAAPYVPTKKKQVEFLLKNITIKPKQQIYELGCGTGSVLLPMAKKFSSTKFIGFEIAPLPFLICWIKSWKYPNVKVKMKNIFTLDYGQADMVFIFLLDESYPKLIKQIKKNVKPDCVIITEAWPLLNVEPMKKIKEPNLLSVYFYSAKDLRD